MRKTILFATLLLISVSLDKVTAKDRKPRRFCSETARDALKSCRFEAHSDYWLLLGKCENLAAREERIACRREAQQALRQALKDCNEQFGARREVCEELGQDPYDPMIEPVDFASEVNNPFFPLVPGTTYIYEGETEAGLEHVEVKVTDETKEILGVVCTVVRDTVTIDGDLAEDTFDFYAQDKRGNVWYFGEHTEEQEDGLVVSIEGSWEAGVDGARPGIIMKAEPRVGDVYRQEFLLAEAEDLARVVALDQTVVVDSDPIEGCLQTEDFTPLEPDVLEHKFYAPGVGVVLTVNVETGERVELIDVIKE